MTKNQTSLAIGIIVATLMVAAIPAFSFAATFAYVNQSGEVSTVSAATPESALMTAPNIDEHSGVLMLNNPADGMVGDQVPGV